MELPAITLPKVELPFDIPVLLHPVVDHFMITLPVLVLLLELINLVMRKKVIGGISFLLILFTVIAAVGAYFTGLVDGKEAYPALSEVAKSALAEHKLLGTYLMLASGVVLLFKLLSVMTGKAIIKGVYILVLIAFVAGIFEQGEKGGELVYKYGMNVEQVKILDDELFDLKEELEEVNLPTAIESVKTPVETTSIETLSESGKEKVEVIQVEGMPEEMVQPQIATH